MTIKIFTKLKKYTFKTKSRKKTSFDTHRFNPKPDRVTDFPAKPAEFIWFTLVQLHTQFDYQLKPVR